MTIMKWQREREVDKFQNIWKWRSRYLDIEMPNKLFHLESSMIKYRRKVGSVRIIEITKIHMKEFSGFIWIAFRNEWQEKGLDMRSLTHSNFDYPRESWTIFCFVSSSSVHPVRNFISDIDILLRSCDIRVLCRKTKFLIHSVLIMKTFSCSAILWIATRCLDESIIVSWAIQSADPHNFVGTLLPAQGRRKVSLKWVSIQNDAERSGHSRARFISPRCRVWDGGTRMLEQLILEVNHIMSYLDILSSTHLKFDYLRFFECFLLDVFVLLSISYVSSSAFAISINVHSIPDTHAVKVFMLRRERGLFFSSTH